MRFGLELGLMLGSGLGLGFVLGLGLGLGLGFGFGSGCHRRCRLELAHEIGRDGRLDLLHPARRGGAHRRLGPRHRGARAQHGHERCLRLRTADGLLAERRPVRLEPSARGRHVVGGLQAGELSCRGHVVAVQPELLSPTAPGRARPTRATGQHDRAAARRQTAGREPGELAQHGPSRRRPVAAVQHGTTAHAAQRVCRGEQHERVGSHCKFGGNDHARPSVGRAQRKGD